MAPRPARRKKRQKNLLRITRAGWVYVAVCGLVAIACLRSQAALMYVLLGAMFGGLLVSILICHRSVASVTMRRDLPPRVWQNETVYLGYSLRNHLRRGTCLGLEVAEDRTPELEAASAFCLSLPARGAFRAGGRIVARRRGRFALTGLSVQCTFPFGLIRARRRETHEDSLLVWPARGPLTPGLLRRGAVKVSARPAGAVQGGDDEFFGLREYRQDDSPRWIHWRRSAGRRVPVVREMSKAVPDLLWVLVETHLPDTAATTKAAMEKRLRVAATLIDHALARGYEVALGCSRGDRTDVVGPSVGRGARLDLLDVLSEVDVNTSRRLVDTVSRIEPGRMRQAQVVALAGASGSADADALAALGKAAGHLTVLTDEQLDSVFEDEPSLAKAEAT